MNKEAEALVDFVDSRIKEGNVTNSKTLTTKEDISNLHAELKEDNVNLRGELKEDMSNLRADLKEDNANLRAELKTEIATTKAEIIKWMFIFWIGQIVATFGFILLFLNK